MMASDSSSDLITRIQVPFHCEGDAHIAYNTLKVDKEPPRGGCRRSMSVKGGKTSVIFV